MGINFIEFFPKGFWPRKPVIVPARSVLAVAYSDVPGSSSSRMRWKTYSYSTQKDCAEISAFAPYDVLLNGHKKPFSVQRVSLPTLDPRLVAGGLVSCLLRAGADIAKVTHSTYSRYKTRFLSGNPTMHWTGYSNEKIGFKVINPQHDSCTPLPPEDMISSDDRDVFLFGEVEVPRDLVREIRPYKSGNEQTLLDIEGFGRRVLNTPYATVRRTVLRAHPDAPVKRQSGYGL